MHLSDVLLGVSDWISVWSSGENRTRCVETQLSHRNRRGGGDMEQTGNSFLTKAIKANGLVTYTSKNHLVKVLKGTANVYGNVKDFFRADQLVREEGWGDLDFLCWNTELQPRPKGLGRTGTLPQISNMPSSAAVVSFAFSGGPGMITMPFGPCSSNTLLNQNLDTLHRDMNLQNSVTFQPLPIETCAKEALKNKGVEVKTGPHIQIRLLFTYLYIR